MLSQISKGEDFPPLQNAQQSKASDSEGKSKQKEQCVESLEQSERAYMSGTEK